LGLDEGTLRSWNGVDGARAAGAEIRRFLRLKPIALRGPNAATRPRAGAGGADDAAADAGAGADPSGHVATLLTTLLRFEAEVHGSSLFCGGSAAGQAPPKGEAEGRAWVSKSVVSGLSGTSIVQDVFESDPRSVQFVLRLLISIATI
jgi:hypothetical protein